jgi:RNA polymerase sigma-70 factor (ECF subfamily)
MEYSGLSAEELVRACADTGEPRAWEEFVRRFQPFLAKVVSRAARIGRNQASSPEQIDDLVQEVFLKICRDRAETLKRLEFPSTECLFGYLKAIAVSVVYDRLRRNRAYRRGGDIAPGAILSSEDARDIPEQVNAAAQMNRQILIGEIDGMLAEQPWRVRAIFWLYYRNGLSAKGISELPGVNLTAKGVESALQRLGADIRLKISGSRGTKGFSEVSTLSKEEAP